MCTCTIFKTRNLLVALSVLGAVLAQPVRAEIVAQWKFDAGQELSGGNTVNLDKAVKDASLQSELMPNAKVSAGATGLTGWPASLQTGYLENGSSEKGKAGLVTKATSADGKDARFGRYLGKAGIRVDGGGTVFLVVSPTADWSGERNQGLFGTGHRVEGSIDLSVRAGTACIAVGGRKYGGLEVAEAKAAYRFEVGKWYFIAASWQGGHNPVLYVREMNPAGPQASPAAESGKFSEVCEILSGPNYDPLAIGAAWINTGGESFTQDGAQAKIAYAAVENRALKTAEMAEAFGKLGME